jgi:hypothetical protein
LEYNVDYINKLNAVFDITEATAKDVVNRIPVWTSKYNITPEEIYSLISIDPTRGKYSEWLIKYYKLGFIKAVDSDFPLLAADANDVAEALRFFDKKKSKLEARDINDYTPVQLLEVVKTNLSLTKSERKAARRGELQVPEGAKHVLSKGEFDVVEITGTEAAISLSSGTKWCTSNKFQAKHYLKQGPLYLIYKNGERIYMVHYQSGQFKDTADKDVPTIKSELGNSNLEDIKGQLITLLEPITGIEHNQVLSYVIEYLKGTRDVLPGAEEYMLDLVNQMILNLDNDDPWNYLKSIIEYSVTRSIYRGPNFRLQWPELEDLLIDLTAKYSEYIKHNNLVQHEKFTKAEVLLKGLHTYAVYVKEARFLQTTERDILEIAAASNNLLQAVFYSQLRGPWPELEKLLLNSKEAIAMAYYAEHVIMNRWPEAEPLIANSASASASYRRVRQAYSSIQ